MNLMLTLDDAVNVAKELILDQVCEDELIRQELEQKCWIPPESENAGKMLNDLIFDINPAEICRQIESDNLRMWCGTIRTKMTLAMVQLPCWAERREK